MIPYIVSSIFILCNLYLLFTDKSVRKIDQGLRDKGFAETKLERRPKFSSLQRKI